MREWRHNIDGLSMDSQDGNPHLLNLRFADVFLIFAKNGDPNCGIDEQAGRMFEKIGLYWTLPKNENAYHGNSTTTIFDYNYR